MKSIKIFLAAFALVFSVGAYSQTDTTKRDTTVHKMDTTRHKMDTTKNRRQITENTTSSLATFTAQFVGTNSNFGLYHIPVLGNYNAVVTSTDNKAVRITADEANPGKIWVEGIGGIRFYALLKRAPDTYKIPSQKINASTVAEGTLIYNDDSKQVNVCTGCGFNELLPEVSEATIFKDGSVTKSDNRQHVERLKQIPAINFIGVKAEQGTVSLLL